MPDANVLNRFLQPDGGSEDNKLVLGGSVESEDGANLKTKLVVVPIGDISSAGSVWVVPGVAGTIVKMSSVIAGAIITLPAGLTLEIGGTAVTDAVISIVVAGSGAGVVDQATPTALNVITATEAIEIIKDGDSTNAVEGVVTLEILPG